MSPGGEVGDRYSGILWTDLPHTDYLVMTKAPSKLLNPIPVEMATSLACANNLL